jgi:hypothetical protein
LAPSARQMSETVLARLRTRRALVWTILGVALVLLLISSLTVWAKRQALDTDKWVDTSGRLLENEQIRDAAAEQLVNALFTETDIEQRIATALPPDLKPLAGPATGLVRQAAVPAAERLLASSAVQDLWREANRLAHEQLMRILEGNEDGRITTTDGDVVLNLHPLVLWLANRVGVSAEVPPDAGMITLVQSDRLDNAQGAVRFIKFFSVFMVVVVLALFVLAIYLAGGFRREALRVSALGLIVVGLLVLAARRVAGDVIVGDLTSPTTYDVGNAVWLIGTSLLQGIALALIGYGLVLLAGVWLAGATRLAVWCRRRAAPAVRDHAWMLWAGVAVLFLLLLVWNPVEATHQFWGILGIAATIVVGVEALRRQIVRESGPSAA